MTPAEQRFDEFYTARFKPLAAQIAVYLGDRAEAEDITQEAFCRAWSRWRHLDDDPIGWVHTVAYRLATSRWRRLKVALAHRNRGRPQAVPAPDGTRLDVAQALAGLPDAQRRAIVLHHLADLSVEDIATREGVAAGTVKSWLHRGRARLAAALTEPADAGHPAHQEPAHQHPARERDTEGARSDR